MKRSTTLASLLLLAACGTGDGTSATDAWTTTTETVDGVVRVVNTPPEGGAGPTLVAEEELRIGTVEGEGPTSFGLVRSVAVLPDGRFAVSDGQAEEVRLFSADGTHLATFGGAGGGPGELDGMLGAYVHDGKLRVAEQGNARLTVFDPDAGFEATYPLRLFSYSFRGPWNAVIDAEGRTHVASSGQYGEGRFWSMVRVYDPEMVQLDSFPYHDYTDESELDEVPGAWRVQLGSNAFTWAQVPYYGRPYDVLATTGDFWSTKEGIAELEVARWSPRGDTALVFTSLRPPDPVTSAERDSAMTELRDRLAQRMGSPPALDPSKVPATKPVAYGLSVDDRGRLWVRVTDATAEATVFDVFDTDGRHAETVRMPFRVDAWIPPVVRGETVWVVVTDELDVQFVVRARLGPVGGT